MRNSLLPLVLVTILAGCKTSPRHKPGTGRLEAHWTGSDTGEIAVTARAEWCRPSRTLEILAIKGDTGLAVGLLPADTIVPGRYPVRTLPVADSTRPAAGVGLRLFAQTSIKGFQGDSGVVQLQQTSPGVFSGKFDARARSVSGIQRLHLSGSFRELTVVPQARGCSSAPPTAAAGHPEAPDTGVD
jgi:hypothetical protein